MKIYFINDENANSIEVLNMLAQNESISIIEKKEYSFRTTKNDYVIVGNFKMKNTNNESLKKYNNLIALVDSKDEETVSLLADEFNTRDVIYSHLDAKYIVQRIIRCISENME